MKKNVLLLMLVLLTSCEGYQTMVYAYGIRQRPEPQPKRVYHYYTPYTYYPVVTPVYVYPPRFRAPYFNVRGNNFEQQHQGGRRR
tara:strand:- start:2207 stop:2461 length:255 start_codon:yes stop_codon:yes gene_type:complete